MSCAEPENQATARWRPQVVTAESVQLNAIARQLVSHALQVEIGAGHGTDMHPIVRRYRLQPPAEILAEYLHEQLPALLVNTAHLAHMMRKMPLGNECGDSELNGHRAMPVQAVLG